MEANELRIENLLMFQGNICKVRAIYLTHFTAVNVVTGVPESVKRKVDRKIKQLEVIEFDLPKGYSAEDAYWTGLGWILDREFLGSIPEKANYITRKEMIDHFGFDFFLTSTELANLYLLLAAANGHKLE